uniref:Uncharacterized protein n=1 Tax=Oryza brachyantha TaxID=4533 RepID=J3N4R0_ORYBR
MASTKVAPLLALSILLLAVAVHGCEPHCSGGGRPVIPTPPVVPTPSYHRHGRWPVGGVRQRAGVGRREDRGRPRRLLPAARRARRPRRRRLPLHRHQGQRAGPQPQRPRRPQPHPQPLRQDLPIRLHLLR